jgi:hypothetical protein
MAPPPLDIHKLIQEPFGPYPEEYILNPKFPKGLTVDLTSVNFECGGSPIGSVAPAYFSNYY